MASANDAVGGGSAEVGDNSQQASGLGGVLGSVGDKLSGLVGGTADSNKGDGYVEKGIDAVQQNTLGKETQDQGQAAGEEVKDEHVSDFIRNQYKSTSKHDGVE